VPIGRRIVFWCVTSAYCAMAHSRLEAQTLSPYSEFQSMSVPQMQTLQAKLTLVGDQRMQHKTLVGLAAGQSPALSVFVPFYRSQFLPGGYNADYQQVLTFTATTQELKAMIDSVASIPDVTDGGVDTGGFLSFALSNTLNGTDKVFESVLSPATGMQLFGRLMGALASNSSAMDALTLYACGLGMLPAGPPTDVTSHVSIELRGFRKDRKTGQFVSRARITNTSGQAIAGPVIYVYRARSNVAPVWASGVTCAIDPAGASYMTLPISGSLVACQQVDLVLRFNNPDDERIELFSQRVFSGNGFR
jgi:hypothetical protein